MSRFDWGTYHLVPPGWTSDGDAAGHDVKGSHRYGPSQADAAMELSQIIGDHARAHGIAELLERAAEREDPILDSVEINAFRSLLEGLEAHVRASLLDDGGRIRPEVLPDLRQRSRFMDLDIARGDDARYACLEVLSRIQALDEMLAFADANNLHVLLV